MTELRAHLVGDSALMVEFGEAIDAAINERVLAFARAVDAQRIEGVIETVPTYRSATVYFDPLVADASRLKGRLLALAESALGKPAFSARLIEIPVLYGGEFGPDLSAIAEYAGVSAEEAIALHASVIYRVFMLGFSPGFPYMGQVPDRIAMPRLAEPRTKVPAGSIGIAGQQTGIYPHETPGGWRLIGRTPLRIYDCHRANPFLLEPGDAVRFVRIDAREFERLAEGSHAR